MQQIQIRHEPSYKQLGVMTGYRSTRSLPTRTSFLPTRTLILPTRTFVPYQLVLLISMYYDQLVPFLVSV
jgi:hypothetical protein